MQTKLHIVKKMKRQATDWEKISATLISEKTLIYRIYKKKLLKLTDKRTNQYKSGQKIQIDASPKMYK